MRRFRSPGAFFIHLLLCYNHFYIMGIKHLEKGNLWRSLVRTTEHALRSGALRSFPTVHAFLEDGGVRFFVRVMASLREKTVARTKQDADPFLPPEKDLTVADITDTHVAVLNKFNVVDHHLLIVTRHFEDQDSLLTLLDFEALWLCMAEYNGLGFYNGGREAGASQQHKHIQMVPLPLASAGPPVPIAPLLPGPGPIATARTIPAFSFLHSFVRLRPDIVVRPRDAAIETFELYAAMLTGVGMNGPGASPLTRQSQPYCFIVTREWMLLVPRSQERFEDISLNSLAYAGSFFVWNKEQLERLRVCGPLNALRSVSMPVER
jgi:ATP adenylyltransferase